MSKVPPLPHQNDLPAVTDMVHEVAGRIAETATIAYDKKLDLLTVTFGADQPADEPTLTMAWVSPNMMVALRSDGSAMTLGIAEPVATFGRSAEKSAVKNLLGPTLFAFAGATVRELSRGRLLERALTLTLQENERRDLRVVWWKTYNEVARRDWKDPNTKLSVAPDVTPDPRFSEVGQRILETGLTD